MMNNETEMAPSVVLVPTIPFTGASNTFQIPCGLLEALLYVPAIIFPALVVS